MTNVQNKSLWPLNSEWDFLRKKLFFQQQASINLSTNLTQLFMIVLNTVISVKKILIFNVWIPQVLLVSSNQTSYQIIHKLISYLRILKIQKP